MAELTKEERELLNKKIAHIEQLQNEIEEMIERNPSLGDDSWVYQNRD